MYIAFYVHSFIHSIEILSPKRWQHRRRDILQAIELSLSLRCVFSPECNSWMFTFKEKIILVIFYPKKIPCKNEDQCGERSSVNIVQ